MEVETKKKSYSKFTYNVCRSDHLFIFQKMILLLIAMFFMFSKIQAQSPDDQTNFDPEDAVTNFQPSLAVVIGILSILFSITFILLVYAKFCHRGRSSGAGGRAGGDPENPAIVAWSRSTRFSGIDKTVIESLPFFRFSSLRGLRQGLECAVCLSRFEDVEILRLLPKCKHAFHIDCIDHWFEKHSSCPLCRRKVSAEDPALFAYSSSMRVIDSGPGDGPSFEVFVEREESSWFGGLGSSFRSIFRGPSNDSITNNARNDGKKRETGEILEEDGFEFHRLNHKIVVSGMMIKHRWSNLTASDLMFWSKEMTNSSPGFQLSDQQPKAERDDTAANPRAKDNEEIMKIKEKMERKRMFESTINKAALVPCPWMVPSSSRTGEGDAYRDGSKVVSPANRRVVSEITAVSRFAEPGTEEKTGDDSWDERMKGIWLPIASRTVRWFANRERNPPDDHHIHITN